MTLLFNYKNVIFRFQPFIFQGVVTRATSHSQASCAGLVHFEVQNPMHCHMCIAILFPMFANHCASSCNFDLPCSFFESQVHFSCKRFAIWTSTWAFSEPDSGFRKLEVFSFWDGQISFVYSIYHTRYWREIHPQSGFFCNSLQTCKLVLESSSSRLG